MKSFDILIFGGTRLSCEIAARLSNGRRKIGLIKTGHQSGLNLSSIMTTLKSKTASSLDDPFNPPPNVDVLEGSAVFESRRTVRVGEETLAADKFVIATGGRRDRPAIQGLEDIPVFHPESVFNPVGRPNRLVVLGGGPLGAAMTDRLADENIQVDLLTRRSQIVPREEPEISAILHEHLANKGVRVSVRTEVNQLRRADKGIHIVSECDGIQSERESDGVLIACGVTPNSDGLGLNVPGVYVNKNGEVVVNEEMQTSCPWVWAAGLVTNRHIDAGREWYQAHLLTHNILAPFFNKIKMDMDLPPTHIPTNPPVASVGLLETEARRRHKDVRVSLFRHSDGLMKLVVRKRGGRLLGAHIFFPHAEELVLYFDLLIRAEISLFDVTEAQHYLPFTHGEAAGHAIRAWCQST